MVKWGASKEEQAATWTYVMLDKDKNKALDRREWKAFHQLINNVEPLRRCGRKLPRYCDVNHDTRISITEWMACLEVTQASQGQTSMLLAIATFIFYLQTKLHNQKLKLSDLGFFVPNAVSLLTHDIISFCWLYLKHSSSQDAKKLFYSIFEAFNLLNLKYDWTYPFIQWLYFFEILR